MPSLAAASVLEYQNVDRAVVLRVRQAGTDHDAAAARDRHSTKRVSLRGVARAQLYDLVPRRAVVVRLVQVDRARSRAAVVVVLRPDGDEIASNRHGRAEIVVRPGVPCGELGDLGPRRAVIVGAEDVGRAFPGVIGAGVGKKSAGHENITVHGTSAEEVLVGTVGSVNLRHLGPRGAAVVRPENVDRTRVVRPASVRLMRAGGDDVAGYRHGGSDSIVRPGAVLRKPRCLLPRGRRRRSCGRHRLHHID